MIKDVKALYICDRKKCGAECPNKQCFWTSDYMHAVNPEGRYRRLIQTGDMIQVALPGGPEIPGLRKEVEGMKARKVIT